MMDEPPTEHSDKPKAGTLDDYLVLLTRLEELEARIAELEKALAQRH